jgi:hypothetical protein
MGFGEKAMERSDPAINRLSGSQIRGSRNLSPERSNNPSETPSRICESEMETSIAAADAKAT